MLTYPKGGARVRNLLVTFVIVVLVMTAVVVVVVCCGGISKKYLWKGHIVVMIIALLPGNISVLIANPPYPPP